MGDLGDEQPGRWVLEARCSGMDPRLFFPERGSDQYKQALAICRECMVTEECLAWAMRVGFRDGIFGGTTPRQRQGRVRVKSCRRCGADYQYQSMHGGPSYYCSDDCRTTARRESRQRTDARRRG